MKATMLHPRYARLSHDPRHLNAVAPQADRTSGVTFFAVVVACAGLAIVLSLLSIGTLAYDKAFADESQASSFDLGIEATLNAMSEFTMEEGEDVLDAQADMVSNGIATAVASRNGSTQAYNNEGVQANLTNLASHDIEADQSASDNFEKVPTDIENMAPATIDVDDVELPYTSCYLASTAPSEGAGLWYGSDSTTDGTYGYFIGHNPGPFWHVMDLQNGDRVTVCDSAGNTRDYHVVKVFTVPNTTCLEDIQSQISGYGESVVLQTCVGDNAHYRIVVAA